MWLLILTGSITPATAQSVSDPPHIADVKFVGAVGFTQEILQNSIQTSPNRRFLGFRGVYWWLWLYRVGERGRLGSRLSRALMSIGEPPSLLDETLLAADLERLRIFFEREGYLQANIVPHVEIHGQRATVTFHIDQGPSTVISRVSYTGLDSLNVQQQQELAHTSIFPPLSDQPLLNYRSVPQRFQERKLIEERQRILTLLRNMGYASVTRDSIRAIVTPTATDSFDVELRIQTGRRFRHGPVMFEVQGPERDATRRMDTLRSGVTSIIEGDTRIKNSLLIKSLRIHPNHWYNQSDIQATKRQLEATGIFSFTDIVSQDPVDWILPHRITVRTRPRHQFLLSTFVRQINDALGDVGNELGGGLGMTYKNANMFGGGEAFSLGATASVAADLDTTLFSSTLAEFTATVSLPYLLLPSRHLDAFQTRTRFTFSYLTARREDLSLIIRGRAAARIRFELQHTPNLTSTIDLMDLSLSQPDTLGGFESRFLRRILGTEEDSQIIDPVQRAQILEDYTQPQINNAIRYIIRSERGNPLRKDGGHSYEASIELGGMLPYVLDRYVFTPGRQEQSLHLFSFTGSDSEVTYRQYVRVVGSFRRYYRLSNRTVFATKFLGGWVYPVGKSTVAPFTHRFYSGGASSVRGWGLRQLGPGSANFKQLTSNRRETNLLGGDIKLEASMELRQTALRDRLGADWILATFTDAGNVWFGPRNPGFTAITPDQPTGRFTLQNLLRETGVGCGVGIRVSWPYVIVRLDMAVRAYDPANPDADLFPTGLRDWHGYFRLGHAF